MGFFTIDQDLFELSRQGWIYLVCTLPLTFVVLGGSYVWMWWTGTKVEKPSDYYSGRKLMESALAVGFGFVTGKEV